MGAGVVLEKKLRSEAGILLVDLDFVVSVISLGAMGAGVVFEKKLLSGAGALNIDLGMQIVSENISLAFIRSLSCDSVNGPVSLLFSTKRNSFSGI